MKSKYNPHRKKIFKIFLTVLFCVPTFCFAQEKVQSNQLKFARLLRLVDSYYVDSTDVEDLTEKAIVHILSELDPHSSYTSKEDVEKANEKLNANFEGVGISFKIYKDTLLVTSTISGGPSEKVGVMAGDRIVDVDGKNIAGIGLKNSDVFDMLRGPKGTEVNIKVSRKNEQELLCFKIIRDKIPIFSLEASYMLEKSTGYIKLSRFAKTSATEFKEAMAKLEQQHLKNLILDLRNNRGGYLNIAKEIVDQFLQDGQVIVYTEGLHQQKRYLKASGKGTFETGNLIVLINEGSASASEIVSGAVQDWDRGVIIGRRSFGKGLVQRPFYLTDGSMVRLTTAHYYTPSGRCIQKPYGDGVEYRKDYSERYKHGELFCADSIYVNDSLTYKTLVNNRNVYGGGGVVPDVFIPMDTSHYYSYFNKLRGKQITYNFALEYIDSHREELLKKYPTFNKFNKEFYITDVQIATIVEKGEKEGIKKDEESLNYTRKNIKRELKALIARDIYSRNDMYKVMLSDDETIQKALEVIENSGEYSKLLNPSE